MAKQPEVTELCRIHAETTLDQMGHALAALARMGLTNIGYELVTEVATFKKKQSHDTNSENFATEWLNDHPTFKATELVKHFEDNGRTGGAAYTALRVLVEKSALKKLSPGHYQRADVKAIAGPKHEISNRDFIWKTIGKRKSFTALELTQAFKADGRPTQSMTSVLAKMAAAKEVKMLGDGKYEVVKHSADARSQSSPLNGTERYEVSNRDFILKRIKGRTKVSVKELEEVFTSEKRNPKSVSAVFSALTKTDPPVLTKAGDDKPGLYLVNKKSSAPPPPPPNANGNGNGHDVSEVAHG